MWDKFVGLGATWCGCYGCLGVGTWVLGAWRPVLRRLHYALGAGALRACCLGARCLRRLLPGRQVPVRLFHGRQCLTHSFHASTLFLVPCKVAPTVYIARAGFSCNVM